MPVSKSSNRNRINHHNRYTETPSRMNGKRANKSSHPNDFFKGPGKHTKPVEITNVDDTGIRDPSRRRHAETNLVRKNKRIEDIANASNS